VGEGFIELMKEVFKKNVMVSRWGVKLVEVNLLDRSIIFFVSGKKIIYNIFVKKIDLNMFLSIKEIQILYLILNKKNC